MLDRVINWLDSATAWLQQKQAESERKFFERYQQELGKKAAKPGKVSRETPKKPARADRVTLVGEPVRYVEKPVPPTLQVEELFNDVGDLFND